MEPGRWMLTHDADTDPHTAHADNEYRDCDAHHLVEGELDWVGIRGPDAFGWGKWCFS